MKAEIWAQAGDNEDDDGVIDEEEEGEGEEKKERNIVEAVKRGKGRKDENDDVGEKAGRMMELAMKEKWYR